MKLPKTIINIAVFCVVIAVIGIAAYVRSVQDSAKTEIRRQISKAQNTDITQYTVHQLSAYDGSDPTRPILLAMDGLVYDVSGGKDYYQPGGIYHYLAGRDSSVELHQAGGSIIQRKYPIVGRLIQ